MASERPICEQPICERCGGKKVVESGPKGKFSGWIPCPDCPAPAATTPDAAGDAMACLDCGHEAHGISCPARTEMSNGEKDICLCDAGWKAWVESKSKSIGGENGQD
jgi:hypothetical protein